AGVAGVVGRLRPLRRRVVSARGRSGVTVAPGGARELTRPNHLGASSRAVSPRPLPSERHGLVTFAGTSPSSLALGHRCPVVTGPPRPAAADGGALRPRRAQNGGPRQGGRLHALEPTALRAEGCMPRRGGPPPPSGRALRPPRGFPGPRGGVPSKRPTFYAHT